MSAPLFNSTKNAFHYDYSSVLRTTYSQQEIPGIHYCCTEKLERIWLTLAPAEIEQKNSNSQKALYTTNMHKSN